MRFLLSLPLPRATLRLADFGCGIGLYLMMLEKAGIFRADQMCGIDSAYDVSTRVMDGNTLIHPDFQQDQTFDIILLMHVLEHIENDASVLRLVSGKCRSGGYLFISVPAFQTLWSSHDVFLGHYRRYNKTSLIELIQASPALKLENIYYYYASILPVVIIARWLKKNRQPDGSDLKPAPSIINRLLLAILNAESKCAPYNRLAGLSVIAVCKKL